MKDTGTAARPRLVVVGGFLGAGKTTALLRLAKTYADEGKRVGLITNDQAEGLVDTGMLRVRGFRVEEVAGACFCCKFDELAQAAERIRIEERPDVLLGEPVGSCTDLAATVIAPFRELHGEIYQVAPYSVLVDPVRARAIVLEKGFGGFSAKVAYIFQKQLEEADLICLNKCDVLAPPEHEELRAALAGEFPRATVLSTSGITGEGFGEWRERLEARETRRANIVPVDYDVYAAGEAELGWLNLVLQLEAARPFDADVLLAGLALALAQEFARRQVEVAHLKLLLAAGGGAAVANCVGSGSAPRVGQSLGRKIDAGRLVVNARVHMDPAVLHALAGEVLARTLGAHGITWNELREAHFRPGRPVPTHRFAPSAS